MRTKQTICVGKSYSVKQTLDQIFLKLLSSLYSHALFKPLELLFQENL
jgi:hypothetical protein